MIPAPDWHDTLSARCIGPRNRAISLIVLHDTCGTGTHNDTRYLADPQDGRAVSVDFTVERDGAVWKLNPDLGAFCCYHAGRATAWHDLKNSQINHASVGIELTQHEHLSLKPMWPAAQVDAVARLCAWLCDHFHLAESVITTHAAIITDGSRDDPRQFPFPEFWERFRAAQHHPPAAPSSPPKVFSGIYATEFGGGSEAGMASAYGGTVDPRALEVSLPARVLADHRWLILENPLNGKRARCRVNDVGPWNTSDAYWNGSGRPAAETQHASATRAQNKRVPTNPAGIDLTPAVMDALGVPGPANVRSVRVNWWFEEIAASPVVKGS